MVLLITGILISIILIIITTFYLYVKWKFTFLKSINLEHPPPEIFYGNVKEITKGRTTVSEFFLNVYKDFKSKHLKHGGIYFGINPIYIPIDPEIIKNILHKDFRHFMNHGTMVNEKNEPLQAHLFNLEDDKWRSMRVKLTPTFTSGKMKMMFQTMKDCTTGLNKILDDLSEDRAPVEIKDILARFTTDIIGSAAFGIECNSLEDPNVDFRKYGTLAFKSQYKWKVLTLLRGLMPRLMNFLGFKVMRPEVEKFFLNLVDETVAYREENNICRNDFMHLLIQLKNKGHVNEVNSGVGVNDVEKEEALTMNELAAQAFVFFIAGFETSSTTMTFAMYELAKNNDVQEKLRDEILSTLEEFNDEISYDSIMAMTYLDRVIQETLRKFPPVSFLPRICTKDYLVPGTKTVIKKGMKTFIPAWGIHMDPDYYPDPEEFDPERFTEENKSKRPSCTWLPFGEGPRNCIGLRFGLLQSKVGLVSILKNFRISLNERTPNPLKMDILSGVLSVEKGIWLNVEKIN